MNKLLATVLDAHGGLQNWSRTTRITATMSLGGPFWAARGWPDVYAGQTVTIDPHREHITFAPFTAPDRMSVLDVGPERVAITTRDGRVVDQRRNPRASFPIDFKDSSTRRHHDRCGERACRTKVNGWIRTVLETCPRESPRPTASKALRYQCSIGE